MRIRAGYSIAYDCPREMSMLLALSLHPSREPDLLTSQRITFAPNIAARAYRDGFGNICHHIMAPAGRIQMSADFEIVDSGELDAYDPTASQFAVADLPDDAFVFLLGSRYCETDRLSDIAWNMFGGIKPGWARVQAICDFTHSRIKFGYNYARSSKTAWEAYNEQQGVCRDFAHLALTLCRCMNIPARYCTGYLGDIGVPKVDAPGDFSGWFDVYLNGSQGGRWFTFDARHNQRRIGRLLMARGRDATDVALATIFGPAGLAKFDVFTDEVME